MADDKIVCSCRKIVGSRAEFLCRYSRSCARIERVVSDWFPVNIGLRQSNVMSQWLYKVYMDGVVRR